MVPMILIDNKSTFDDFQMIMTSYSIPPPAPKIKLIDLPIGDGSIDLTEAIYGDISYEDRECEFNFVFLGPIEDRAPQLELLSAFVHGRRRKVMTLDDPEHYYIGRMMISAYEKEGASVAVQLTMIAEPYKYKLNPTKVTGTIPAGGSVNLDVKNARMRVIPKITVSAAATISHAGNNYSVQAGTWRLTNIVLTEGSNILTITAAQGTTYTIEYQEGAI